MSIETQISVIVSFVLVGFGLSLTRFAVKNGGHRKKRDPKLVQQIMRSIDWSHLDAVMDPPRRAPSENR